MLPFYRPLLILFGILLSSDCGRSLCNETTSEFMPSATILEDGSAWDPETSTLYPSGTYWNWTTKDTNTTLLMGCPCKLGRPCLRKCCQMGQVMDSTMRCMSRNSTFSDGGAWFRPELTEQIEKTILSVNGKKTTLGIVTEKHCFPKRRSRLLKRDFFIRISDAKLCLKRGIKEENFQCLGIDAFCIDYVQDKGNYLPVKCPRQRTGYYMPVKNPPIEKFIFFITWSFLQAVSSLSLLIVLLLYIKVPSLRTVHGKCHMCHTFSLLIYYTLQTMSLHSRYLREMRWICFIIGPCVFYFHLAPLSWLNVMSLNILLAFLNLQPVTLKGNEWKKFLIFSLYAWGMPLISFTITLIGDFIEEIEEQPFLDDWCVIGKFRNWNYKKDFMYTLMAINTIIFACTALKIYMLKRETLTLHTQESRRHYKDVDNGQSPKLFLRLLLLMGFNWVLEPITKATYEVLRKDERLAVRLIWYILALGNQLQGLFILLMFIGNDKLTGAVWIKFSKTKIWPKLSMQASLRHVVNATIALHNIGRNKIRKDSTDTTEKELSDWSRSNAAEVPTPTLLPLTETSFTYSASCKSSASPKYSTLFPNSNLPADVTSLANPTFPVNIISTAYVIFSPNENSAATATCPVNTPSRSPTLTADTSPSTSSSMTATIIIDSSTTVTDHVTSASRKFSFVSNK